MASEVATEVLGLGGALSLVRGLIDTKGPGSTTEVTVGSAYVAVVIGDRLAVTVLEVIAA